MAAKKATSTKAAKAASKVLRDGRTGPASKSAAGSALVQREPTKKTARKASAKKSSAKKSGAKQAAKK
jgi:hypothetical protein